MERKYNIAVVGATGMVGEVFLELLVERNFPVNQLYPLASERSAGETVMFADKSCRVENTAEFDFSQVDIAFFSAGLLVSEKYAPIASEAGCIVIDNTSCFRYRPEIPLVIPEVNAEMLSGYRPGSIIANPNCSVIQMLVALKPIYDAVGISRINVATYQAVSGAGKAAVEELARQTASLLNGQDITSESFSKQIAFNVLPQIDSFQNNGYTREEMKMVWETKKILNDDLIRVNPTAVRVPVFFGHSEALHIETERNIEPEAVRDLLREAQGVTLVDDDDYPTAITHAASHDSVFVSRVRQDLSHSNGIDLWVVSDNVRKGAALNSIQIAEMIISNSLYLH
jgi:aspartate-semialdehyde dehydrogenase